jgi:predicted ATPase/GAF domain-containing protein/tRNA A-37 threonylcarbamoyl transferase component Bud32
MIRLNGYQVSEKIHESQLAAIYRATRENDNKRVIIKVLNAEYPTPREVERIKREFEITKQLTMPGVITTYGMEQYQNTPALIFEDYGGVNLRSFVGKINSNMELFLNVALQLSGTLGEVHRNRIIHKDIKPSNILINHQTFEVKLVDFGISSQLEKENQIAVNPTVLEGTLEYMSPEQTGRMNRAIDYRSDFYSLGVTFYELLCGKLPFSSDDPMELVHGHIAKKPIAPKEINPAIPQVISDIVMKLMAKTAEERYQSAKGLMADLEKCLAAIKKGDKNVQFTLGEYDSQSKLNILQKLYGREEETKLLLSAFDRISSGPSELILVSGYSGIGKSMLVNDIHKPIVQKRGYFISGKFDQFNRNIPYSSIMQAFRELVTQLLAESQQNINQWKNKILKAVGTNGQVIVDLIPEMELIIGKQTPLLQLGATEAQNRFNITFQSLVDVFAKEEHPLVVFLDDLQWADSGSLHLIQSLITDKESKHLLLIGTYRDNEVNASHPLMLTLDEIKKKSKRISELTLKPLAQKDVLELICDSFNANADVCSPLADLVLKKTNGNPFFIGQFLKKLYEEKAVEFDAASAKWKWDMAKITQMNITDNVVELMSSNIRQLPGVTQKVIRLASCIGNTFELKVLARINGGAFSDTAMQLVPAMEAGFILPIGNDYKLLSAINEKDQKAIEAFSDVTYRFVHDRVQQAAYSLIDEKDKKEIHLSIGRTMAKGLDAKERDEKLFDITNHFNFSIDLIKDAAEKKQLAEMNLQAGIRAKSSAAYAPALKYISSGMDLLGEESWNSDYSVVYPLHMERSECEHLCGNIEAAEKYFGITLDKANSKLDKAKVYEKKIHFYTNVRKFTDSYATAQQALKLFSISLPAPKFAKPLLIAEFIKSKVKLRGKKIEDLVDLPLMKDENLKMAVKLISAVLKSAYQIAPELCIANAAKVVNLALTHGNSEDNAVGFVAFGGIFQGGVLGDRDTGYRYGKLTLAINDKFNFVQQRPECQFVYAYFLNSWKHHIKDTEHYYKEAIKSALETGDFFHGGCAACALSQGYLMRGMPLAEVYKETERYMELAQRIENTESQGSIKAVQQAVLNYQGKTASPSSFETENFNEEKYIEELKTFGSQHFAHFYYINKMQALFLCGEYDKALEMANESEKFLKHSIAMVHTVEHYFYHSLVLAAVIHSSPSEGKKHLSKLMKFKKKMQKFAEESPVNYENRYLLVAAEVANITKAKAGELYNKAIESAKESGYLQNQAIANELAAKYYLAHGNTKSAKPYLLDAHYCYIQWGATVKAAKLKETYPEYITVQSSKLQSDGPQSTIKGTRTTSTGAYSFDIQTIMKASQTLSGEVVLEKLLKKLMSILIENAGAHRGLFILNKNGEFFVEAEGHIDSEEIKALGSVAIKEDSSVASVKIINYVSRTNESVVLSNAREDKRFQGDAYLTKSNSKSVLCFPLMNQGKLVAIIYLENDLTEGAFTADRIEILKLLSGQAAISIENAFIYANLEQKVQERTKEIVEQKKVIEEKQKEIIDSINYAKRIQFALLASDNLLKNNLPEHFVMFKPKDVVSGDFYWGASVKTTSPEGQSKEEFIYVTADCTGHGVPGAFMSLLNISKLSQCINENKITQPDLILNNVRNEIIGVLNAEGSAEESKDGMDAVVCKLDIKNKQLEYAAANNSFYIIRDNKIVNHSADKMPVGKFEDDLKPFTYHKVQLQEGDVIYTFTDGYADQFGGPKGKKFKYKQLEEILLACHKEPMQKQSDILSQRFDNWKGSGEQVDDVLIIGVRI